MRLVRRRPWHTPRYGGHLLLLAINVGFYNPTERGERRRLEDGELLVSAHITKVLFDEGYRLFRVEVSC